VRDLDVHRKLLKKLVKFGSDEKGAAIAPKTDPVTVAKSSSDVVNAPAMVLPVTAVEKQAKELDAWLQHARQHQAAGLKKNAAKAIPKFDAEAAAFESAISQSRRARRRVRSAAVVALESFARLVDQMQQLDAGNLHDFRKGAKKARYIAESAAEDAHALTVGKALKKLQDEIGDWHDWLVLADEARVALGDEGEDLIALLDGERDRHYVASMKTVDRLRGKLLGEWLAATTLQRRTPAAAQRKLPAQNELPS
jgi:CHAD domain-containing protein